jgi:hypothetical protein
MKYENHGFHGVVVLSMSFLADARNLSMNQRWKILRLQLRS